MDLLEIIIIAVGLSMDAFAVSIASGLAMLVLKVIHVFRIAVFFGLFQALMPSIGWLAGKGVSGMIEKVDHWVVFILLVVIGGKMIYEGLVFQESEKKHDSHLTTYVLLFLSVATSIDALAVGISFGVLRVSIMAPVIIIGVITFVISIGGVIIGKHAGHFFESKIEVIGGLVLIGIGIKILIQHLLAGA